MFPSTVLSEEGPTTQIYRSSQHTFTFGASHTQHLLISLYVAVLPPGFHSFDDYRKALAEKIFISGFLGAKTHYGLNYFEITWFYKWVYIFGVRLYCLHFESINVRRNRIFLRKLVTIYESHDDMSQTQKTTEWEVGVGGE
jgi:hypothetical protein